MSPALLSDEMCNLYSNTTAQDAMRQLFGVCATNDFLGNAEPRPAIWPKWRAPVVRIGPDGERELVQMNWGFLTRNVSKKTGKELAPRAWNNARDDKVSISGLWKGSFAKRRCLLPATAFREAKGRNPATDVWFGLKGDEQPVPFAFAGIWQETPETFFSEDSTGLSHTMLTTTANDIVRTVHPKRMPVILEPSDYMQWLTGTVEEAHALLRPFPADRMEVLAEGVGLLSF